MGLRARLRVPPLTVVFQDLFTCGTLCAPMVNGILEGRLIASYGKKSGDDRLIGCAHINDVIWNE